MHDFSEIEKTYTPEEAIAEASRCLNCKNARCKEGCPVGNLIPEFIAEIKNGNFHLAEKIIEKTNLLGSICGRVCPHEKQCQAKCILGIKGTPIQIGKLERFACDRDLSKPHTKIPHKASGKKAAIIGSGPSGLACASHLATHDVDVTVYESRNELGGVLSFGIPEFRLPNEILHKEIAFLESKGVKFVKNTKIGTDLSLETLQESNDFIFIGIGSGIPTPLNIEGESLPGVYPSTIFLSEVNSAPDKSKIPLKIGDNIVVIGGGNVAMDCARCAIRLAPNVSLLYRRTIEQMPARKVEIQHTIEEGVKILELSLTKRIIADEHGNCAGIEITKAQIEGEDDNGRPNFVEILHSNEIIKADTIIVAIGQHPDTSLASSSPALETNSKNCIITEESGETSIENIYAGGDIVTGAATVIRAMSAGRNAAQNWLNKH